MKINNSILTSFLIKKSFFIIANIILIFDNFKTIDSKQYSSELVSLNSDEATEQFKDINENCLHIHEKELTNLFELSGKTRKETTSDGGEIQYNFCENINSIKGSVIYKKENETIRLAGDIKGEDDNVNKVLVQKDVNSTKVTLKLAKGDFCKKDVSKKYQFYIELTCKKDSDYTFTGISPDDPYNECQFTLEGFSKYACPIEDEYDDFLKNNSILYGIILIVAGLILAILGYKFIKASIIFVLSGGCAYLSYVLFSSMIGLKGTVVFILIGLFIIIGIAIALFINKKFKYFKVYIGIIGGVLGSLLGDLIYMMLLPLMESSHPRAVSMIFKIGGIVLGVFAGIFFARYTCIIGTSSIGSYSIMRGISLLLIGRINYIDERQIFTCAKTGNYPMIKELIQPTFYIYPAIFLVLSIISSLIQKKINSKLDEVDDYKDLEGHFEKSAIDLEQTIGNDGNSDQNSEPATAQVAETQN